MDRTETASEESEIGAGQTGFVRFVIVGGGRTGSNLLVQALNSNPGIKCFGELFNAEMDAVDFSFPGYENFSNKDRALRDGDFERFLRERVYCHHPEEVQVVGFKLLYVHPEGFPGLLDRLAGDTDLRIVHIRRRNLLRMFLSTRIALSTGVWIERKRLTLANVRTALRHPLRVVARLRRPLRRPKASRVRQTLTEEQCIRFFHRIEETAAHFDESFRNHPKITVFYEDIVERRDQVLAQAQEFVGVEPATLSLGTRKQNPEPISDLIENYEELRAAFKDTGYASFFD